MQNGSAVNAVSKKWWQAQSQPFLERLRGLLLQWILPCLVLLYAWQQSHFQFEEYWPEFWRSAIRLAMQTSVMVMFLVGCRHVGDRRLVGFSLLLATIAIFYSMLDYLTSGVFSLGAVKAAVVAVALLPVVDDPRALRRFITANYWLGIVAIGLSTIPLLHFMGWVDIPHEQVGRVGGELGRPDLNPLSFGLFGRTESYAQSSTGLPRLQGWSSEPLHWSYFVFWTLACWIITYPQMSSPMQRTARWAALALILVQIWFLQSTTAILVAVACLATIAMFLLLRRVGQPAGPWLFAVAVLAPGLAIPFGLASINNIEHLILNENFFAEGGNWRGKIEFLGLGADLFIRFAPTFDSESTITVSHNLVFDFYLRFGYLLLLPMLLQFLVFLNATDRDPRGSLGAAALILVLNHALTNPGAFFMPSGVMFQLLLFAVSTLSFHKNSGW